jgi:outer membrane protein
MKTTTSIASLGAALALLAFSTGAQAQEPDSNTARVGMYAVFYHTAADQVSGPFVPPGVSADVGNVETVYLAYLRRLTSHLQLELAAGVPPKTDTIGKGPASLGSAPWNGVTVGTVKWLSPSLVLEYNFFDESAAIRPFVGVGINFTHFYDRQINAAGQAALGGPTYITLSNSIGPVGTLGAVYHFMHHWSVDLSFSAAEIASHLEANTDGIVRKSYVSFNPHALVFAVGYSF